MTYSQTLQSMEKIVIRDWHDTWKIKIVQHKLIIFFFQDITFTSLIYIMYNTVAKLQIK